MMTVDKKSTDMVKLCSMLCAHTTIKPNPNRNTEYPKTLIFRVSRPIFLIHMRGKIFHAVLGLRLPAFTSDNRICAFFHPQLLHIKDLLGHFHIFIIYAYTFYFFIR